MRAVPVAALACVVFVAGLVLAAPLRQLVAQVVPASPAVLPPTYAQAPEAYLQANPQCRVTFSREHFDGTTGSPKTRLTLHTESGPWPTEDTSLVIWPEGEADNASRVPLNYAATRGVTFVERSASGVETGDELILLGWGRVKVQLFSPMSNLIGETDTSCQNTPRLPAKATCTFPVAWKHQDNGEDAITRVEGNFPLSYIGYVVHSGDKETRGDLREKNAPVGFRDAEPLGWLNPGDAFTLPSGSTLELVNLDTGKSLGGRLCTTAAG